VGLAYATRLSAFFTSIDLAECLGTNKHQYQIQQSFFLLDKGKTAATALGSYRAALELRTRRAVFDVTTLVCLYIRRQAKRTDQKRRRKKTQVIPTHSNPVPCGGCITRDQRPACCIGPPCRCALFASVLLEPRNHLMEENCTCRLQLIVCNYNLSRQARLLRTRLGHGWLAYPSTFHALHSQLIGLYINTHSSVHRPDKHCFEPICGYGK
jgi:hypothetical protein